MAYLGFEEGAMPNLRLLCLHSKDLAELEINLVDSHN